MVVQHLPYTFLFITCPWVSALHGPILLLSGMFVHSSRTVTNLPIPKMSRAPCAETCRVWCKGTVRLLWTNGFVLHWKNWSQNVTSVFHTGIDCSFPKGSSPVAGFYFVLPKQNCSHTVKQDNILAVPSWFRMKGNVRALMFLVGWMWFSSQLQREHAPRHEWRMSPGDLLLLLPARLIHPALSRCVEMSYNLIIPAEASRRR